MCGHYGQIFGTEKQCRKYYSAWSEIFPNLFDGGKEVKGHEPASYEYTFDLVNILIAAHDSLEKKSEARQKPSTQRPARLRKKGFFEKLFGQ